MVSATRDQILDEAVGISYVNALEKDINLFSIQLRNNNGVDYVV